MIPPTPTPLPPGTAHFSIPSSYSLWASTSSAIQFWNWLGVGQIVLQAMIIVGIVLIGLYVLNRFVNDNMKRDSEK